MAKSKPKQKKFREVHKSSTIKFPKNRTDSELNRLLTEANSNSKMLRVIKDAITNDLSEEEKALNSMATLISGWGRKSVGAVCFDGEKFLISTNEEKLLKKAQSLFTHIKDIQTPEGGKALEEDIYQRFSKNIMKNRKEKIISIETELFSKIPSIHAMELEGIAAGLKAIKEGDKDPEIMKNMSEAADIILKTVKGSSPNIGVSPQSTKFLEELVQPAKHIERVKLYVKEKGNYFSSPPKFFAEKNAHAEMNILNELFMQGKLTKDSNFFIGDTKKCCAGCHLVITSTNDVLINSVKMSGTHGSVYVPWLKPKFLDVEETELRKLLAKRDHTDSKIEELVETAKKINNLYKQNIDITISEYKSNKTIANKRDWLPVRQDVVLSPLKKNRFENKDEINLSIEEEKNLRKRKRTADDETEVNVAKKPKIKEKVLEITQDIRPFIPDTNYKRKLAAAHARLDRQQQAQQVGNTKYKRKFAAALAKHNKQKRDRTL